jgi:hypothetical protein
VSAVKGKRNRGSHIVRNARESRGNIGSGKLNDSNSRNINKYRNQHIFNIAASALLIKMFAEGSEISPSRTSLAMGQDVRNMHQIPSKSNASVSVKHLIIS